MVCSELTPRSLFRVVKIFDPFRSPAQAREARLTLQILVNGADCGLDKLAILRAGARRHWPLPLVTYLFKICARHKMSLQ
jgi:hypothetical protein